MRSPHVIFVGEFEFPEHSAAAFRVLGIGETLRASGLLVMYLGMERRARPEDRQCDGSFRYQGFPYLSEHNTGDGWRNRLRRGISTHLTGQTTLARLERIDTQRTKAIVVYNGSSMLLRRLMRFCQNRGVALIADRTEWHNPRHLPLKWFDFRYWDMEFCLRRLVPKIEDVFVSSTYLRQYYEAKGCHAMRLPTLIDVDACPAMSAANLNCESRDPSELRLVFAGSLLRERWDVILAGLAQMLDSGHKVRMEVFGSSRESLDRAMGPNSVLSKEFGHVFVVHGRLPRDAYLQAVMSGGFVVMLRDIARWSKACFPSKLPELMARGLPLISNAHSDCEEYIRDGMEGLLVASPSVPSLVQTLDRAWKMTPGDRVRLGENARRRARECFGYHRFVEPLRHFVEEAVRRQRRGEPSKQ
jgi:glycosyltransferase involved in cell wall biosynthesis